MHEIVTGVGGIEFEKGAVLRLISPHASSLFPPQSGVRHRVWIPVRHSSRANRDYRRRVGSRQLPRQRRIPRGDERGLHLRSDFERRARACGRHEQGADHGLLRSGRSPDAEFGQLRDECAGALYRGVIAAAQTRRQHLAGIGIARMDPFEADPVHAGGGVVVGEPVAFACSKGLSGGFGNSGGHPGRDRLWRVHAPGQRMDDQFRDCGDSSASLPGVARRGAWFPAETIPRILSIHGDSPRCRQQQTSHHRTDHCLDTGVRRFGAGYDLAGEFAHSCNNQPDHSRRRHARHR